MRRAGSCRRRASSSCGCTSARHIMKRDVDSCWFSNNYWMSQINCSTNFNLNKCIQIAGFPCVASVHMVLWRRFTWFTHQTLIETNLRGSVLSFAAGSIVIMHQELNL